jgi:DNA-binding LacI/PurR family transcriptional regulator
MGRLRLPVVPEYVVCADYEWSEASAEAAVAELLRLEQPPTAIVAAGDTLALGALRELRRQGKSVPEDVALVSFDDPVSGDLLTPPITALARHDRELGEIGGRLLLEELQRPKRAGRADAPSAIRVPLELVIRASCGCSERPAEEDQTP